MIEVKEKIPMPTELHETTDLMMSPDYKDRFKAEYYQLRIRYEKLYNMLLKWDKDELDFIPTCPRSVYELQTEYMFNYLAILEARAQMEGIVL